MILINLKAHVLKYELKHINRFFFFINFAIKYLKKKYQYLFSFSLIDILGPI